MLLQHPINKPPNITPLLLILPLLLTSAQSADPPQRHTKAGEVYGVRLSAPDGRYVDAFLGIPYARPPVGNLRFRRPEPAAPWSGFRNASQLPASCFQEEDKKFGPFKGSQMWNPNTPISEDCLYLNVWMPLDSAGRQTTSKAVMVWIHGGGFYSGTSTLPLYDGRIIASKGDVIVVSMQYRLGAFGFLYLGNDDAPGNMGLLDQNLALRWVHDNIESFGGDPRRVTLFGESAGAASISLHLLSPLTKDLVNSAILQSGSALGAYAYNEPAVAKKRSLDLVKKLGCNWSALQGIKVTTTTVKTTTTKTTTKTTTAKMSTKKPAQEHSSSTECMKFQVETERDMYNTLFAPTLDNHFLTHSPANMIHKPTNDLPLKVKLLAGVNRNEGYYFLAYDQQALFPNLPQPGASLEKNDYEKVVKGIMRTDNKIVTDSVIFEYGTPERFSSQALSYRDPLDNLLGDIGFNCPVTDFAKAYATAGQLVYLYQFNHRTSANPWPEWMGVMHGYEIDHVFGQPMNTSLTYREEERRLSAGVVSYWTNFAKSGNPNIGDAGGQPAVTWPSYTTNERKILFINTTFSVSVGLRDRQCEYWQTIVPQLRQFVKEHKVTCAATDLIHHGQSTVLTVVMATAFSFILLQ